MSEHICMGFRTAGVSAGLKKHGGLDLGLIVSDVPASAAAVFTRNLVQAAPVQLSRERARGGRAQAVVVNSGCANCCTGDQGRRDAEAMSRCVARELSLEEDLVLVASTGVIGQPLAVERIAAAAPRLAAEARPEGHHDLAAAIMTTDTQPKLVTRQGRLQGGPFVLQAVAKGAGMIRPDMATMLCFAWTDAAVDAPLLDTLLREAVEQSFNRITIDGDTSTNDTVVLMANGASGAPLADAEDRRHFQALLNEVFLELAKWIVRDGEGATKLVEIRVQGALSGAAARQVADTIANSPLVKTALFGEDANWGRILGAAGRAGVAFDPEQVDLFFDDVQMVAGGRGCGAAAEARASAVLKRPELAIVLNLHQGEGGARVFTCDFSVDYVKINADYRS
jgi:glutamate N-acetyltransferase/amino-acid N-acetyltransferase